MSSVATYMEQFKTLLNEVSHQSEVPLISFFVGGLKLELRSELKVSQSETLRKAFVLAKLYEAQRGFHRGSTTTTTTREPLIKQPPSGSTQFPIVRKMLTVEERRERTAKGLCICTRPQMQRAAVPNGRTEGVSNRASG